MVMAVSTVIRRLPVPVVARATGAHPRTVERWRAGVIPRRRAYLGRLDDLASILAHQAAAADGEPSRAGEQHTLAQGTSGWARHGGQEANR